MKDQIRRLVLEGKTDEEIVEMLTAKVSLEELEKEGFVLVDKSGKVLKKVNVKDEDFKASLKANLEEIRKLIIEGKTDEEIAEIISKKAKDINPVEEGSLIDLQEMYRNMKDQIVELTDEEYFDYVMGIIDSKVDEGYKYYKGELFIDEDGLIDLNPWISKDGEEYDLMFSKEQLKKIRDMLKERNERWEREGRFNDEGGNGFNPNLN